MFPELYQVLVSKFKTNDGEGDWKVIFASKEKNMYVLSNEITGFNRSYSSEDLDNLFHTRN